MKVVCLLGSPRRHGNSVRLANHLLEGLQARGAEVASFTLNELHMRGCQACDACKRNHECCVVDDELSPVLNEVFQADALVMASPVYYGDVSAQLKTFIDRSYSYLKPGYIKLEHPNRFPSRKPLVFILAQGHRDSDAFADILPRYTDLFRWTGFADVIPVRVIDVYHPGDVDQKRPEVFERLERIADELYQNGAVKHDGR